MLARALVAFVAACVALPCVTAQAALAEHGATATTASTGRVDVFTVGADDAVWQRTYLPATGWGAWTSIGGNVTSPPDAVTWPDGRIDVVARGADRHAWTRTYLPETGRWSPWTDIGGPVGPEVSVTSAGDGRVEFLARGAGGRPMTRGFSLGAGWTAWARLDERSAGSSEQPPQPLLPAWGRDAPPHVAALGAEGDVWIRSSTALGPSAWDPLGAPEPLYSTVHWYGQGGSTCLQTGFPATDSRLCPSDVETLEGAVAADIAVTESGRYCNHYNLGGAGNACHAEGNAWSLAVVGSAANNYCNPPYAPCGVHEYVSFAGEEARNRPWSAAFASNPAPSLLVTARADPARADVSVGAWGYVCPILHDVTTGGLVEYCFEQWRVGTGFPRIAAFDAVSACASASGHNVDQVITQFAPGTRLATQRPGSGTRYVFAAGTDPAPATFAATISPAELLRAVDAVNAGCGRMLSSDPADYALLGVEHGVEGGGLTALIAATSDLALSSTRE
jgi:hypothetical protein